MHDDAPPPIQDAPGVQPLLRSPLLRRMEQAFAGAALMERAGKAIADWAQALRLAGDAPIVVFAGPGNNGGDALVAARLLRQHGLPVVVRCGRPPSASTSDAARASEHYIAAGGQFAADCPDRASLVIDGLFGIGLRHTVAPPFANELSLMQSLAGHSGCPLLALDTPSGLDADTGRTTGPAVMASHTLTFLADKPGLHTAAGPDHCGHIRVATLGIDVAAWLANLPADTPDRGAIISRRDFASRLQPRRHDTHKGSFGAAGIVGGNTSMIGAALLAGRAALQLGAGRIYLGLLAAASLTVDPLQPELMLRSMDAFWNAPLSAVACGPGLGLDAHAEEALAAAIKAPVPLVLDADALTLLAASPSFLQQLRTRPAPTVLTPHPSEAARLLGCTTEQVQADRLAAALAMASQYAACVALKGCGTVIATPDGRWWINTTGNPALASAGTGDILTGMVTSLLAQGWPPLQALQAAVHLHGAAADDLCSTECIGIGLTASEVIGRARQLYNRWVDQTAIRHGQA